MLPQRCCDEQLPHPYVLVHALQSLQQRAMLSSMSTRVQWQRSSTRSACCMNDKLVHHHHGPKLLPKCKGLTRGMPLYGNSLCSNPAGEDRANMFWYLYQALVDVC